MPRLGLEQDTVDQAVYDRAVRHFRERNITLPRFSQLADPSTIPASVRSAVARVDADDAAAQNLFRVHWWNDAARAASPPFPSTSCCRSRSPASTRRSSSRSATASR